MSSYNNKYYKPTIVKAMNDYECAISDLTIKKGDYYLHLAVEDSDHPLVKGQVPRFKSIRVAKEIFGFYSMEKILDLTGEFTIKNKRRIEQLEKENIALSKRVIELTSALDKCQSSGLKREVQLINCKNYLKMFYGLPPYHNTVDFYLKRNEYWSFILQNFEQAIIDTAKEQLIREYPVAMDYFTILKGGK